MAAPNPPDNDNNTLPKQQTTQQQQPQSQARKSLHQYARAWGESSVPPTLLATLITALHARPFQWGPMLFPPALLFTSYVNLLDYKVDAAGMSAAWSGLYILLAARRKPKKFLNKFGARGMVRGAAMGVGFANMVTGGLVYMFGKRRGKDEDGDGKGL